MAKGKEIYKTSEELRDFLKTPYNVSVGHVTVEFELPRAEWCIKWIEYPVKKDGS